jgi:hypothetical protein
MLIIWKWNWTGPVFEVFSCTHQLRREPWDYIVQWSLLSKIMRKWIGGIKNNLNNVWKCCHINLQVFVRSCIMATMFTVKTRVVWLAVFSIKYLPIVGA